MEEAKNGTTIATTMATATGVIRLQGGQHLIERKRVKVGTIEAELSHNREDWLRKVDYILKSTN